MPDYTQHYGLVQPQAEEFYNVEDQNGNMDIIDQTLHEKANTDLSNIENEVFKTKADACGVGSNIKLAENLTTETTGIALDATQGKILNDLKANKVDPVFTGALSSGRLASTLVGSYSFAHGSHLASVGFASHAEGGGNIAAGSQTHAEGTHTIVSDKENILKLSAYSAANKTFTFDTTYDNFAAVFAKIAVGTKLVIQNIYYTNTAAVFTVTALNSPSIIVEEEIPATNFSITNGYAVILAAASNCVAAHAEGQETKASGNQSHAEGYRTVASGERSHAEGYLTTVSANQSHAEGYSTKALGNNAHVEGWGSIAEGNNSHAEGYQVKAGDTSHAEGYSTQATGMASHAEGRETTASGNNAHAEGYQTKAYSSFSHAEGSVTQAGATDGSTGSAAHAEGHQTKALADRSHAEGWGTTASGNQSHAEGYNTTASGNSSHAEGASTTASGSDSHAEGSSTKANGNYSHAEGNATTAENTGHAEGYNTQASGVASHAQGWDCIASGAQAHAEGVGTTASGAYSHAQGQSTQAWGTDSCAMGYKTTARNYQLVVGKSNTLVDGPAQDSNSSGTALLVVGNGTSSTKSHAMLVMSTGQIQSTGSYSTSGADYAEMFEWLDGNPEKEDRRGHFVTLDGEKIRIAETNDNYILGVVSANPAVIGDQQTQWVNKCLTDVFGSYLYETVTETAEKQDGSGETEEITGQERIVNPNYDPDIEYTPRDMRPEWAAIGWVGKLVTIDDGTCEVNGYAKVADGGIATKADGATGYRVLARKDETHVLLLLK